MTKFHVVLNFMKVFLYLSVLLTWGYAVLVWGLIMPMIQWLFPSMDIKTSLLIGLYPLMSGFCYYLHHKEIWTKVLPPN